MKVVGFTIVRNAVKYAYPVEASIRSLLPLCDEVVVAVGNSDDGTRDLISALEPGKIRIVDTVWDESLKRGGTVLAVETNKALAEVSPDADWAIYLQADEVLHEQDYSAMRAAMQEWQNHPEVDGLLLKYIHFWGSYDYVGASSKWYRHEIRVIRPNRQIFSYRDAQGFRKANDKKLQVKPVDARVYHYGWVREPVHMQRKLEGLHPFWHGHDQEKNQPVFSNQSFDYSEVDLLKKFTGSHPGVMQTRIAAINWTFEYDLSHNRMSLKEWLKSLVEKMTGKRPFDYKNYKLI